MFDKLKLGQDKLTLGQETHFTLEIVRSVLHNENIAFLFERHCH